MASGCENVWSEMAKDPNRKAKSNDPGWKYAFWPNLNNKDVVKCALCGNVNHAGIRRLKQHLIGGFGDVRKCPNTTEEIAKEMFDFIKIKRRNKKKSKIMIKQVKVVGNVDDNAQEISSIGSNMFPGAGTSSKMTEKSVDSIGMRTEKRIVDGRDNIVDGRDNKVKGQKNLGKTAEEKERVDMHIANFFYECGIPLTAAKSRSYEIMIQSIGQFGPGLLPPTGDELRTTLLEKAKAENLRKKHEDISVVDKDVDDDYGLSSLNHSEGSDGKGDGDGNDIELDDFA